MIELKEVKYKKCKGCGRNHAQAKWLGNFEGYNAKKRMCKGYEAVERKLCKPCERDVK